MDSGLTSEDLPCEQLRMGCSREADGPRARRNSAEGVGHQAPGCSMRDSQGSLGQCMYLGHLPDYITGHTQALHEGACRDKSTGGPQAQFPRGIPKRP